ncbi:mannose-1-phosphate guanylyltransferase [Clostridium sp. JS66]|uniref:mannose-1-phosphate guanylyltransferase n=1 Tax=Clostridium sp. JS66 TaxID=3064705 RepID=UPI00298E6473|nr:mannose-1-phosphate guanylyltransferase [Clostridium sp. JS66]WPC43602.1 mannose-1-phosphate guanylyltransferase [Clostridium sp. JS66]
MICALIMAGGKGKRFWPLSTEKKPKQFLKLLGEKTMLRITFERLQKLIPNERIFVVTSKQYTKLVREEIPELSSRNIIVEPLSRNTAPCIILSALKIRKYYKDSTLVVLPSDHRIENNEEFINTLVVGEKFIAKNKDSIVTIGIRPNRPEIGYGYIKCDSHYVNVNSKKVFLVNKFIEKPDLCKAEKYLQSDEYLWNCGIFIWKIETILQLAKKYATDIWSKLVEIENYWDQGVSLVLEKNYREIENISIDYAIMENVRSIYTIPCEFQWDDLGNWTSIERYRKKDNEGNVTNENSIVYKSKKNIVITKKKALLNNVDNLIVVETEDYILVSSKEKEQEIKIAKNLCSNLE